MSGRYAVGVDVGGTKILGGLVDCASGAVLASVKTPTPPVGKELVLAAVMDTVTAVMNAASAKQRAEVSGIGLGVAGQVDAASGVVLQTPNLGGGFSNLALAEPLRAWFGLPVALGNDVEVAGIGEGRFGAGKGLKQFACVFVGTGIGGALMQDGVRLRGATGSAGEIGHILVKEGGRRCGCGQRGHLEAYASRTAIVTALRKAIDGGAKSSLAGKLRDPDRTLKSKALASAVEEGDGLTLKTVRQAGKYLGLGLVTLINLWNPQRIVIGGGMVEQVGLLLEVAAEKARTSCLSVASGVEIVRSGLGDQSGMIGAALLSAL